ncbi:MAG: ribosomal protein S18 acetylase RimI-like enzyme [Chlamydiales bacterium]|jgi:ribosomal protein S18 acetylase RimI-like enzyme
MRASLRTELLDRAYLDADRRALLDLDPSNRDAGWNSGQLDFFLAQERAGFRVIAHRTETATPIAFYAIQHHQGALFISNLMVARRWRRQGIGSFAMDRIVRIASKLECERVTIEVQERNLAAQLLCQAHGFRATEISPRQFSSQDGYRMERRLDGDPGRILGNVDRDAAEQRQSGKPFGP